MKCEIVDILKASTTAEIAEGLVSAFLGVERSFVLKQWKTGGLDAGHFVEMARRYVDQALSGTYKPIGVSLSVLNEAELTRLARLSGHESYRLLIPRVLFSIYSVRNKRGIGHVSEVTANAMDANLILASCKWILSEMLRVTSSRTTEETSSLVNKLSERYIDGFWTEDGLERILHTGLSVRDQILFYLFNRSPASPTAIHKACGSDISYIKRTLKTLDGEKLVVYDAKASIATLLPTGYKKAETVVENKGVWRT
jgi:hypothetical protein